MEKDCNNCKFALYEADEIPCRDCDIDDREYWQPRPQTNADRIRAMSDEDLAELIVKHHPMHAWNKQVRKIYFGFDDHRKDNQQRAWLEWLKQPAEEVRGDGR